MWWQGGSQCCSAQLWVTVGLSPHRDVPLFHHSWLIPSSFRGPSLFLQSQLDPSSQLTPSFPACSEAGLPVGDGFLAKLSQIPPLDF